MRNDGTEFTSDRVEHQIDMLAQARQTWPGASGDAHLISELSRVSIENETIVQRSWQRLAERAKSADQPYATQSNSMSFHTPQNLFSGARQELLAEQKGSYSREITSRDKRSRKMVIRLLEICAALLVIAALVVSTAIVIGNNSHKQTQQPTVTTQGTASGASALYVSSPAGVYRVDPASGKALWHYADKSTIYSRPYIVENVVIVADDSAGQASNSETRVVGLNSFTGKLLWTKMIPETTMLATGDGIFVFLDEYIPPSAPLPPLIAAYQATTGKRLWTYQPSSRPGRYQPFHRGTIADGKVYVTFDSQAFLLQASSGKLLWQKPLPKGIILSPPVVSGKMLYFVSGQSESTSSLLFGIDADSGEGFHSQVPASGQQDVRAIIYSLAVVDSIVYVDVSAPPATVGLKGTAYLYTYNASSGAFLARYEQSPDTSFIYFRNPLDHIQHLLIFGMVNSEIPATYDLVAFNTTTKTRAWSIPMEYPNSSAEFLQSANNVIYLNVFAHLYAYSLGGKLLHDYVIPVSKIQLGPAYGPFIAVVA